MNIKKDLTPKNTEELKPGLFIQKTSKGYRQVNPIIWDGKWRIKDQFSWKNLFTITLIFFIVWSYTNETSFCRELQEDPCEILSDIQNYCQENNPLIITNYGEHSLPLQSYP